MKTAEIIDKIISEIDGKVESPFVTAKFGNEWKEHAKEHYPIETVIDVAWRQGRRAILMEEMLRDVLQVLAAAYKTMIGMPLTPESSEMLRKIDGFQTFRGSGSKSPSQSPAVPSVSREQIVKALEEAARKHGYMSTFKQRHEVYATAILKLMGV